ncbi:MAG: diacylglycerol kinase family lipid kinase [Bacteroidales bacterium]|nr:diacylglycerol kinase family lipid kinase [Bacteroidales bacterium]
MAKETLHAQDYFWHVIINPNACNQECFSNWGTISTKLGQNGIRHEMHKSDASGRGIEIARELCQKGERHLIVIGGDGTINEVVNGIFTAGINTQEVYLAVLPLGRGNDWARTHKFPGNFIDSIDLLLKGNFIRHDIGKVETIQNGQKAAERYFINIAGFGFDADVIYDTTYNKPHFLGISVYILSLIRTLFHFKAPEITVKTPDHTFSGKSFLSIAAICQYNGGGMRQAPMAKPNDGLLDVVVIPNVGKLKVIANLKHIFTGNHLNKLKGIEVFSTPSLTISSKQLVRGEVEGEVLRNGDYNIQLLPSALNTLSALE